MDWMRIQDERGANGELTDVALAADALVDNGCDCGEDESGTCLACICEKALKSQCDEIERLRAELEELKEKLRLYTDPPYIPHREEGP